MKRIHFLISLAFISVLMSFQFSVGQIIEDDEKEKTNKLSDDELTKLFKDINDVDLSSVTDYAKLLERLNKKGIETWYFGHRDLSKFSITFVGESVQEKIINAFKTQFFDVCKIHDVLCIIDAGIFFAAQTKEQLIIMRSLICADEKIYRWGLKQLEGKDELKELQKEFNKFIGLQARQAVSSDLTILFYTHRKNPVVILRKTIKDIAPFLYPEPNFSRITAKLFRNPKLKSEFEFLKVLNELGMSDAELKKAIDSGDKVKREAADLIKKYNKVATGRYRFTLENRFWWTVLLKHSGTHQQLKAIIDNNKPKKIKNNKTGGPITAWLLVRNGINAPDVETAKYFFSMLKHFNFDSGIGDIVAQALSTDAKQVDALIPFIAELNICEAVEILLKKAKAGDYKMLKILQKVSLTKNKIKDTQQIFKQNRGNKNWQDCIVILAYKYCCYESIDDLILLIQSGEKKQKINVYKAFSKLASMKTVRCLIAALNNEDKDIKKTAFESLKDLFPALAKKFNNDFVKWKSYWTNYSSLPGYEEIK